MNILQVSTADIGGGAEKIARMLHQHVKTRGHQSWLAVGVKRSQDPSVLSFPHQAHSHFWSRMWKTLGKHVASAAGTVRGAARVAHLCNIMGDLPRRIRIGLGHEYFGFPGTSHLLKLLPQKPDVIHCHNLHGYYFDLRTLPLLSKKTPVILTLHDSWLLTGHCAYALHCERWQIGCGHCPDLTIYPAVSRDATHYNWRRKQRIYARSRVYLATPCDWLMQQALRSMLAPAIIEHRVIPYGVELSTFHPAERQTVRAELGLPAQSKVLLFAANGIRHHQFKDYLTMRDAAARVAESVREPLIFLALGESGATEQIGRAKIEFVPYQNDPSAVARYYQAADLYVHAAKADTFPNAILEALACGTPVVATAVDGIPEQVEHAVTGLLTPPGDVHSMAAAIRQLLEDDPLRRCFGQHAAQTAQQRFDLNRMTAEYLQWYQEIQEKMVNDAARRSA